MSRRPYPSLLPARLRGLATACLTLLLAATMVHADKAPEGIASTVRLTSLDWPPFSGPDLPNRGLSTAIVERTLARAGLMLEVEFLPWQRAVTTGLKAQGRAGYFPEYRTAALDQGQCLLSNPIGSSPLGFAERVAAPVDWRGLADLAGRRIGTVRGYVNTDGFDRAVADGRLIAEPAVDDATNLRKLAAGRLDLVVIDANVLAHLLSTDPALRPLRAALRFNPRLLEDKSLHVCFRPGAEGEALRRRFNRALAHDRPESVLEASRPPP
ncbi:ABC transporter substrate-binding protein [Niveispirillum sp.]|uniref:substrate-binding periplasmic protein n=1 Tax=Niveispirillum sp. TaxID=1917217 RepID=UPI001B46F6F8|nr:transporter substrate-binding domain-containing protein [Niveispirillum sp.]MBP7336779.1 transporter substrate-binding domain-containing protein [Niveispirillum sp.]